MTAYVYLIRLDGAPKYVGFTTQTIEKRWKSHIHDANRAGVGRNRPNGPLQKAIRKYEKSSFSIETLYESEDVEYVKAMEIHYIWLYHTFEETGKGGYNLTPGGSVSEYRWWREWKASQNGELVGNSFVTNGMTGRHHSKETKEKMRQISLDRKAAMGGRLNTPEAREKMRQAALKRIYTTEEKEKMKRTLAENRRKWNQTQKQIALIEVIHEG